MHRLNLAAKKNRERRVGYAYSFDQIHKKLDYSKRFTDNIGKKINDDFKKNQKIIFNFSITSKKHSFPMFDLNFNENYVNL